VIRFSAALVIVAVVVLIGGVASSTLLLVYLAIILSAAALIALAVGVAYRRDEIFGPAGRPAGTATVDGTPYDVWYGKGAWTAITYDMTGPVASVSNLNIGDLARDAVSRHYMPASCYLVSMEAGFEVWHGGQGLATNYFAVNVDGSGG